MNTGIHSAGLTWIENHHISISCAANEFVKQPGVVLTEKKESVQLVENIRRSRSDP
jgi:hypothetical protein